MIRTQVQLTDEQTEALRELASREGRSLADLVREGVTLLLRLRRSPRPRREELVGRALAVCGNFRSGVADFGRRHDAEFTASVESWTSSSTPRR